MQPLDILSVLGVFALFFSSACAPAKGYGNPDNKISETVSAESLASSLAKAGYACKISPHVTEGLFKCKAEGDRGALIAVSDDPQYWRDVDSYLNQVQLGSNNSFSFNGGNWESTCDNKCGRRKALCLEKACIDSAVKADWRNGGEKPIGY